MKEFYVSIVYPDRLRYLASNADPVYDGRGDVQTQMCVTEPGSIFVAYNTSMNSMSDQSTLNAANHSKETKHSNAANHSHTMKHLSHEDDVSAAQDVQVSARYTHYKHPDHEYEVIAIAQHSETNEQLVIYKALHASSNHPYGHVWARPLPMFLEDVLVDGVRMPRFTQVA